MRLALNLDATKTRQQQAWAGAITNADDDVIRWRNLAKQARAAVKLDGEKQSWRFLLMARSAPTPDVLEGINLMATELGVYSPDIEEAIEERFALLVEMGLA